MMIGIRTGAANFATSGAVFVVTSPVSLDSQKKDNLEMRFGSGDEVISFVSSASWFQKKESLDSVFESGDVDDVVIFDGKAFSFVFSASSFTRFKCKFKFRFTHSIHHQRGFRSIKPRMENSSTLDTLKNVINLPTEWHPLTEKRCSSLFIEGCRSVNHSLLPFPSVCSGLGIDEVRDNERSGVEMMR